MFKESMVVSIIGTLLFTGVAFLPIIRHLRKSITSLLFGIDRFVSKYQSNLTNEMKEDFKVWILIPLDQVTDSIALLLDKLNFKKSAQRMRDMLR